MPKMFYKHVDLIKLFEIYASDHTHMYKLSLLCAQIFPYHNALPGLNMLLHTRLPSVSFGIPLEFMTNKS